MLFKPYHYSTFPNHYPIGNITKYKPNINFLLMYNQLPQIYWLKTKPIYYPTYL